MSQLIHKGKFIGGTSNIIVDITQAHYDELSDAQKMDPSIYYNIKDGIGEVVSYEMPFKLGIDKDGNYGYYKVGADTVTPFKSGGISVTDITSYLLKNQFYVGASVGNYAKCNGRYYTLNTDNTILFTKVKRAGYVGYLLVSFVDDFEGSYNSYGNLQDVASVIDNKSRILYYRSMASMWSGDPSVEIGCDGVTYTITNYLNFTDMLGDETLMKFIMTIIGDLLELYVKPTLLTLVDSNDTLYEVGVNVDVSKLNQLQISGDSSYSINVVDKSCGYGSVGNSSIFFINNFIIISRTTRSTSGSSGTGIKKITAVCNDESIVVSNINCITSTYKDASPASYEFDINSNVKNIAIVSTTWCGASVQNNGAPPTITSTYTDANNNSITIEPSVNKYGDYYVMIYATLNDFVNKLQINITNAYRVFPVIVWD